MEKWDAQQAIETSRRVLGSQPAARKRPEVLEVYEMALCVARLEGLTKENEYQAFMEAWRVAIKAEKGTL